MNDRGYIYVLANSSMPDLVKVGKTTRLPSQRAQELSGVTGIPTPFIVVYEQLFEDCSAAEDFVHTVLKQKGFRETDNREFFRAPVSEIIHIISRMPGQCTDDNSWEDANDALISNHDNDELDDLKLNIQPETSPWTGIWETAENYYLGLGDCIQDYAEAMKLYREAAKLGCLMAYLRIGEMFSSGDGIAESKEKAIDYFREGARKGNYHCYLAMAMIFIDNGHEDNYKKCMMLFFKNRKDLMNAMLETYQPFHVACSKYILHCCALKTSPLQESIGEMAGIKGEIIDWINRMLTATKQLNDMSVVPVYEAALNWVTQNL